jgi:UDP-2,4-diacetamido-2,4,6-trideoxy-beta-L-altropyranose hydrolase
MIKKNKVLIFKVASSKLIGSGHIYRCLKIAERIKIKKIYFFTNDFNGNFNFLIKRFKIFILKNNENKFNNKIDANETITYLKSIKEEKIFILDNYFHNINYQKKISKYVDKLIIIDDYLKKNFCDMYINENFYSKKIDTNFFLKKNCKKFIGTDYSFIVGKRQKKIRKKKINLFLFFGGFDLNNLSFKILKFLKDDKKLYFRLILNDLKQKKKIKQLNIKNLKIYKQNINFYNILKYCNFAIISGGSTVWDILYNNIPLIAIPTAKNQMRNLKELSNKNKIFLLYKIKNKKNFNNFFYRSLLNKKISKLDISCIGIKKIVKAIENL